MAVEILLFYKIEEEISKVYNCRFTFNCTSKRCTNILYIKVIADYLY